MGYSKMLRKLFSGISLCVEDLLLLESFQVKYLPERVPQKEFAALIRKFPFIKNYLILRDPSIKNFIRRCQRCIWVFPVSIPCFSGVSGQPRLDGFLGRNN